MKKEGLWSTLKIVITIVCLYFLFAQFQNKSISLSEIALPNFFGLVLVLEFILMFLNWHLEAYRWKISIESFEEITLRQSWIDILSGLAMNWVLPLTSGDFIVRIGSKNDKYKTTSAILLNRGIMLLFTLLLGMYGVISFIEKSPGVFYILAMMLLIVFSIRIFRKYLARFLAFFTELKRRIFLRIISISLIRYLIFFGQFLVLLYVFLPDVSLFTITAGIGWIFLMRSVIPSLFGGLGVREASAFLFFQGLIPNISMVIFPVFILWLINTALPSLFGLILIWKLRFKIAK